MVIPLAVQHNIHKVLFIVQNTRGSSITWSKFRKELGPHHCVHFLRMRHLLLYKPVTFFQEAPLYRATPAPKRGVWTKGGPVYLADYIPIPQYVLRNMQQHQFILGAPTFVIAVVFHSEDALQCDGGVIILPITLFFH